MLKVLNRKSQEAIESKAMMGVGALTSEEIVEKLASTFCVQYQRDFRGRSRMVAFAGPNRTGALTLLVAATLTEQKHPVEVVLLNPTGTLPDIVVWAKKKLQANNVPTLEVQTDFHPPVIDDKTIVLDGICGLDQSAPFTGELAGVTNYINAQNGTVVSLEIPSGLLPEDNSKNNLDYVIQADYTYTFHGPKLCFFFAENEDYVGKWKVINAGLDDGSATPGVEDCYFGEDEMSGILHRRPRFSNKYDYGRTLLIAGSRGMMGAAVLAAKAAYTSGTGHLTVHVPKDTGQIIYTTVPEALVHEDASESSLSTLPDLARYDAVAVGPGLGRMAQSRQALSDLLRNYHRPLILDADALYHLSEDRSLLNLLPTDSILTPHAGEFDRLFGPCHSGYERFQRAKEVAMEYKVNIVLKGAYTVICSRTGHAMFNSSGNPGLASAGTGDVLTGVLLALLGKEKDSLLACLAGVYMHGYAADLYRSEYQEESLTASSVIRYLPMAMRAFLDYGSPMGY